MNNLEMAMTGPEWGPCKGRIRVHWSEPVWRDGKRLHGGTVQAAAAAQGLRYWITPLCRASLHVTCRLGPAYVVWLAVLNHHHRPWYQRCRQGHRGTRACALRAADPPMQPTPHPAGQHSSLPDQPPRRATRARGQCERKLPRTLRYASMSPPVFTISPSACSTASHLQARPTRGPDRGGLVAGARATCRGPSGASPQP